MALASWRYQLRWAAAPAMLAADMALLNGSAWLSVGGRPAGAGLLLLAATWAQALLGLWATLANIRQKRRWTIDDGRRRYRPSSIVHRQ